MVKKTTQTKQKNYLIERKKYLIMYYYLNSSLNKRGKKENM